MMKALALRRALAAHPAVPRIAAPATEGSTPLDRHGSLASAMDGMIAKAKARGELSGSESSPAMGVRQMADADVWSGLGSASERPIRDDVPASGSERPTPVVSQVIFGPKPSGSRTAGPAPPVQPEGWAEEKALRNKGEASKLILLLPPGGLPVEGEDEEYDANAVKFLSNFGTRVDKVTKLRLYLENLLEIKCDRWRSAGELGDEPTAVDLWPLSLRDAVSARAHFREKGLATAADRVPVALQFAVEVLSLPGEYKEGPFADSYTSKPRTPKASARALPGPYIVHKIADGACSPDPALPEHEVMKRRELYLDMLGSSRGAGFHASRVAEYIGSDGTEYPFPSIKFVVSTDKLGRENVDQWVPCVDVRTNTALEWSQQFAQERVGLQFVISGWTTSPSSKGSSYAHAVGVARDDGGALKYAAQRVGLDALAMTVPAVTGLSAAALKAGKLSGLHLVRHLAGELSEMLRWPEPDGNTLGDWTDAVRDASGGYSDPSAAAGGGRGAKRKRASTRQKYYAPNASYARQVRCRLRFYAAMAAGFQAFGPENLTPDTTWAEVFPETPPPALAGFYGPPPAT